MYIIFFNICLEIPFHPPESHSSLSSNPGLSLHGDGIKAISKGQLEIGQIPPSLTQIL